MLATSPDFNRCSPQSLTRGRILIIGDLNVDNIVSGVALGQSAPAQSVLRVGGTAYNAALAFKRAGFYPLVFGKIGEDLYGKMIRLELEGNGIPYLLAIDYGQGDRYVQHRQLCRWR